MDGAMLKARLATLAGELGFVRTGVARAEPLEQEGARLRRWLERGHHGSMAYMARTADVRVDPAHSGMLPGAQSVVVFAMPYDGRSPRRGPDGIARYAFGRDYHNVLHRKLKKLARLLRDAGFETRAAVDSMPVFERAWAERAGVGFIGKNCCLIVPGIGSHVFLAALVTTAELPPDAPMPERCGQCRRCLDACPTRAFVEPRSMDARRCLSYLTIEHRGSIDGARREDVREWIFGCDVCQDVCPFNHGEAARAEPPAAFEVRRELVDMAPEAWLALDDAAFARRLEGSALRRAGREGLARNAALALGNRRDRRALPVLQHAADHDPSPTVRDAAGWALEAMGERDEEG